MSVGEWNYLKKLARDLLVWNFVKDKLDMTKTYEYNHKIILEKYKEIY